MKRHRLTVKNLAQIKDADIEFGDLTVLVGPQASGKSLLLQLWKFALDRKEIVPALREAGDDVSSRAALLDAVLGQGMHAGWTNRTEVVADGVPINPDTAGKYIREGHQPSAFFIPAHRGLLLADGWAQPFGRMNATVPVVARLFSDALNQRFVLTGVDQLSPRKHELKREYRDVLDAALFHGGTVRLMRREGRTFRLSLTYGKTDLPFMTWTAGQREATPLLFGLMQVLPSKSKPTVPGLEWVIVEEPEMGLHPRAIDAVMLLVLECLFRGYRVVLSTHSPLVLDVAWALKRFHAHGSDAHFLIDALGAESTQSMRRVAAAAIKKDVRVHALTMDGRFQVRSVDISELDPSSDNEAESGWGGLTSFSSRIGDAVAAAANEAESRK